MTTAAPVLRRAARAQTRTRATARRTWVSPAATPTRSPAEAVLRGVLGLTALGAAWLALFGGLLSGLQEARDQHVLYSAFRQQLAEATAPVAAPVALGAPVATLSVPSIGLRDLVVVQGSAARQLAQGPGHRTDTVLPGQAGVSVLYGRAVSYGAPFARVPSLRPGARIYVVTGQGRFSYTVERVRRAGSPVSAPVAGSGRLTLVTAEGRGALGRWVPTEAVLVDAALERPAPAGPVDARQQDGGVMATGTASLVPLVLWLEALVLVGLGAVWAGRRWGVGRAWPVGAGPLLAVLWGTSHAAWGLLPNLL